MKLDKLRHSYLRGRTVFALDVFLSIFVSLLVVLSVRALFPEFPYSRGFLFYYFLSSGTVSGLLFLLTKTFRIIIRHLTVRDLGPFLLSSGFKGLVLFAGMLVFCPFSNWWVLIAAVDALLTFIALIGMRLAMIYVYEVLNQKVQEKYVHQRILVYGTSDKSVATIVRMQNSPHYRVIGFVDRVERKDGLLLDQLPVFHVGNESDFKRVVLDKGIDAVLFSRVVDAQAEEEGLIGLCARNGVKTLIVPGVDEVSEGQSLLRPREVRVEDLLGRKEIVISMDEIKAEFSGKVVMVTGAAGSIGSELVRQLATVGVKRLILYDNAETPMHYLRLELEDRFKGLDFVPVIGDVRQPARLDFAFRTYHPQVVFHAAAYKHVPLMEENPCEAVLVNVFGTRNVADKCREYEVEKMVMISTDKAVNPTNIMGCTKRLAEIYVQSLGLAVERGECPGKTRFVTTRFGNVLGSNGSVIPRFREQIAKGGPVTVTHPEINRFFMTIPEACRLVMEAATKSQGNEIFVFDMGEPVKIDLLARRMITLAGFVPDKDIKIEYSGLRPGEKLYEEVLSDKENTLPSFHERIRVAKVREYDYPSAKKVVGELEQLARDVVIPDMVRLMKKTVPEYKSDNSRFCAYDKE